MGWMDVVLVSFTAGITLWAVAFSIVVVIALAKEVFRHVKVNRKKG